MPFSGFDDWDDCMATMMDEEGHDEEAAESICGALQAEEKADEGDPQALMDALDRGAGLIADVGVDLVSGVDVPAVDSKWVMTKSGGARKGHDFRANSPILLSKADDEDQRIAYAAAMIPREPDKEGDVVPTPTVEKAAHDFIKSHGGVDTDHSLIDGEGEVVESWVLKEERTFDLPGGTTETYPAGTWMVGIEWGKDAWERIKDGELTGLSIYGMAEHVALEKAADCGCATAKDLGIPVAGDPANIHLTYLMEDAAETASRALGLDGATHPHTLNGDTVYMPGATHERFVAAVADENERDDALSGDKSQNGDTHKGDAGETDAMAPDQASDGDATGDSTDDGGPTIDEVAASVDDLAGTVESLKEAVEAEKQDAREAAADLADEYDLPTGDVLDILSAAQDHDAADVLSAIDSLDSMEESADEADKEDDEDDDEDEQESSVDKRADDANLEKGSDGRQTAAKGITGDDGGSSGLPSYAAAAEQESD